MTQPANTASTPKYSTLREDLEETVYSIAPTETPVMMLIGRKKKFTQPYHEWSTTDLAAADEDNAEIQGGDVTTDAPTTSLRLGNHAQLMDKVARVASTAQKSKVAGDIQKMAKQILFKSREIKRDMEKRIACNKVAVPATDSVAGKTAGIGAFLRTNVDRGVGGANPTLSGTTTGYPNAAPTDGTQREFTEDLLQNVVQGCWDNGATPTHVIVGSYNKRKASTFTGNAQKTSNAAAKKVVAAVAIYESDFGTLQIVPARLTVARQALVLDPEHVGIGYLQPWHNFDLAKTGHSDQRAIAVEFGLVVDTEKAHGIVADLTTSG